MPSARPSRRAVNHRAHPASLPCLRVSAIRPRSRGLCVAVIRRVVGGRLAATGETQRMCTVANEPLQDLDLRGTSLRELQDLGSSTLTLVRCDLSGADLRGLDLPAGSSTTAISTRRGSRDQPGLRNVPGRQRKERDLPRLHSQCPVRGVMPPTPASECLMSEAEFAAAG